MKNKGTLVFSVIISIFLSAAIFSSCSKSKTTSKIIGKWKAIDVGHVKDTASAYYEVWEFNEDQTFKYTEKKGMSYELAHIVNGRYSIDKYNKITIYDFETGWDHLNGTWDIVKLKDQTLMMVLENNGLLFREFSKL